MSARRATKTPIYSTTAVEAGEKAVEPRRSELDWGMIENTLRWADEAGTLSIRTAIAQARWRRKPQHYLTIRMTAAECDLTRRAAEAIAGVDRERLGRSGFETAKIAGERLGAELAVAAA